jgi:hypothetical protein
MSDTKDKGGRKPLTTSRGAGTVKQSFSHGRSKQVEVVTKKKKRVVTPGGAGGGGSAGGGRGGKPPVSSSDGGGSSKRAALAKKLGITEAELIARQKVLLQRKAQEEVRKAETEKAEEAQARLRNEQEKKLQEEKEREEAEARRKAEEERRKVEEAEARIAFYPDDLEASHVTVYVDLSSAIASKKLYTDSLKGAEWLDSGRCARSSRRMCRHRSQTRRGRRRRACSRRSHPAPS